ncbi:hypothetical protein PPROV_000401600 [Pycnococcus provasolii]|uniref:Uncharacterized protein n=1 Tax=Pycnococcus provasolii TaxID=41880 RepID=A0A830HDY2_9CHLO|nr:hypothetical protein PPROV_000401600 [Pycnococcus provasolii]
MVYPANTASTAATAGAMAPTLAPDDEPEEELPLGCVSMPRSTTPPNTLPLIFFTSEFLLQRAAYFGPGLTKMLSPSTRSWPKMPPAPATRTSLCVHVECVTCELS